MLIKQHRKGIDIAPLQFKAHQRSLALDLIQSIQGIGLVPDIPSDHIPQEVARQPALSRIDQCKPLIQLPVRIRVQVDLLYLQLLDQPRPAGDQFDTGARTSHLILPASSGGHDLLHAEYAAVKLLLFAAASGKLQQCTHTRRSQNTGGSQSASLGHTGHLRVHGKAASQA